MAVTRFQSVLLKRLARRRQEGGERYVAGGVALNTLLAAPRRSRDIDLFHDSDAALAKSWAADRDLLGAGGYQVKILREAPTFVEALVSGGSESTVLQWARDSAFRFFPLVEDALLGLALHPFDLATNKVLAMAGRLEVRDWIDVIHCDERLQPFGYLVWAACAKDPGYNPNSLLAAAGRLHYAQAEVNALDFDGPAPDAAALGLRWHEARANAEAIVTALPPARMGTCIATPEGALFRGGPDLLRDRLRDDSLLFHEGRLGGSWPRIVG